MHKNLSLTQGQLGLFVYVAVVAVFVTSEISSSWFPSWNPVFHL